MFGVFERSIDVDDEFSRDGDQGLLMVFSPCPQLLVEGHEGRVLEARGQCRHVEDASGGLASASDVALTLEVPAVVVDGREAGQGGRLAAVEGTQFGHVEQEGQGGPRAGGMDGGERLVFGAEFRFPLHLGEKAGLELADFAIEVGDVAADVCLGTGIEVFVDAGHEIGPQPDKVAELPVDFLQFEEPEGGFRQRGGQPVGSVAGDKGGIDAVGLGDAPEGADVVLDEDGVDLGDGDVLAEQGAKQQFAVAARRLTADMARAAGGRDGGEELFHAAGAVGQLERFAVDGNAQRVLG